jgi:hypothetical protein
MTTLSASGRPAWQEPARMEPRHCAMRSALKLIIRCAAALKLIIMRVIACYVGLLGLSMGLAPFASAQDIDSVIALPDAPFVLPVLSSYIFPADPRSGDVLTQRANNNRDGATYVPGLNSKTVSGFRRIGFMPASGSDDAQGHHDDGSEIWTQPLYAGAAMVRGIK